MSFSFAKKAKRETVSSTVVRTLKSIAGDPDAPEVEESTGRVFLSTLREGSVCEGDGEAAMVRLCCPLADCDESSFAVMKRDVCPQYDFKTNMVPARRSSKGRISGERSVAPVKKKTPAQLVISPPARRNTTEKDLGEAGGEGESVGSLSSCDMIGPALSRVHKR